MLSQKQLIHTQFKQAFEPAATNCRKELNLKIFMFVGETTMSCSTCKINQPDTF